MAGHHRRDSTLSFRVIVSISISVSQPPRHLSICRRGVAPPPLSSEPESAAPESLVSVSVDPPGRAGRGSVAVLAARRAIDVAGGVGCAQLRLCRARIIRGRIWSDLHPVPGLTVNLASARYARRSRVRAAATPSDSPPHGPSRHRSRCCIPVMSRGGARRPERWPRSPRRPLHLTRAEVRRGRIIGARLFSRGRGRRLQRDARQGGTRRRLVLARRLGHRRAAAYSRRRPRRATAAWAWRAATGATGGATAGAAACGAAAAGAPAGMG